MPTETSQEPRETWGQPSESVFSIFQRWNSEIANKGSLSLRGFLDGIADLFYADVALWWMGLPDGHLVLKEAGGPGAGAHLGRNLERGHPLAGEAYLQGKPALITRVALSPDAVRKEVLRRLPRAHSGIAFPIFLAGSPVAAIEVWNRRDGTEFHRDLLGLCGQLSQWLPAYVAGIVAHELRSNAILMNQRFVSLSIAFSELPDLKTLLMRIAEEAKVFLACEEVGVLLHHEKTQELLDPTGRTPKRVSPTEGLIGSAFWKGTPVLASPATLTPGYLPGVDALYPIYTREMLIFPLTTPGKVLGVLVAYNRTGGRFAQADLESFAPFASLSAVAIENQLQRISLRQNFINSIESLVQALEAKDPETRGHSQRVRRYATAIGKLLIRDPEVLQALELSALLHDIGKIGMRDDVLFNPGSLTDEDRNHIRKHPEVGARILEPLIQDPAVLDGVKYHHERWDGSGYPEGLKGSEIPLFGRIIAVADTFDALTSDRPY
ncbi:MAG: HD domain-containing phosphohydrolase, partial [bacterium JZ-2024 1]